ncbi:MAG: hypothetical protein J5854_01420 [Clostridia bacterium]|nr:hypothetical protein [Clostridia bacterium]
MEEERCTLFSFAAGNVFAAVLHFLCAVSGVWCLVFPLLSILLFLLEKNAKARVACIHTAVVSLMTAILGFLPTIVWLIVLGASKGQGAFFVIVTVLFAGIMMILGIVLLAVEVTCGIKSLRDEPIEVPLVTSIVAKIAKRL